MGQVPRRASAVAELGVVRRLATRMLPDVKSPEELPQFDDGYDEFGYYDGWEHDEELLRQQCPRLESIFGLPFHFQGRVAWQDGSLLAVLSCPEACRAKGSFGDYFDLGLLSFSFSMFGRLFTVGAASTHASVTPERIADATNLFRELNFLFVPETVLRAAYPQSSDMPFRTWGDRYFSSAF